MSDSLPTVDLPVESIFADPNFNCRGVITPFDVIELSRSIELNGLQQPVVVQPFQHSVYTWRLVMGHRRHKAFQVLKKAKIPCVIKKDLKEHEARAMNLIENLERKDLTIMQEARAIEKFKGYSQSDVAKMLGKSSAWVHIRFIALRLPQEIQQEIDAGFITQEQIKDIANIPSVEGRYEAARNIKDAKIRNEKPIKIKRVKSKALDLFTKKRREVNEIFEMQDKIREILGNNFGTRCLAWAAGEISDNELFEDIQAMTQELVAV